MTAFLDTNVIVRHLTGEPSDQARRATALLGGQRRLLLTDLVVAEVVYVLGSFYRAEPERIAAAMRMVIGFPTVAVLDASLLMRTLELYEAHRLDFADAYLVASAELSGVGRVASFDRAIDRVGSVERLEPAAS